MRHNITFWNADHPNGTANGLMTGALAIVCLAVIIVCAFLGIDGGNYDDVVVKTAPAIWKVFAFALIPLALNMAGFFLHRNAFLKNTDREVLNAYYSLPKNVRKTYNVKHAALLSLDGPERRDFLREVNKRVAYERQYGPLGNLLSYIEIANQTYEEMK